MLQQAWKDLWVDPEVNGFLIELNGFLRSTAKSLDMSELLRDELITFQAMLPASHNPRNSGRGGFAPTHWNSRQPLVCQLSNAYADWVLFCQGSSRTVHDSKLAGDVWEKHYRFLRQPMTYMCTRYLADLLSICDSMCETSGLVRVQSNLVLDVELLRAELTGYILEKPIMEGLAGPPSSNSNSGPTGRS